MNKKLFLLVIFLLFAAFTVNVSAHVALDYPQGGEIFQAGVVVTIQWHVAIYHGPSDWDLFFSSNGGVTWETIAMNLPESQLSYEWMVPNIETSTGRIKVVQDNNVGTDYEDASGDFSIVDATGVQETDSEVNTFKLFDAYPNPFNPSTTIKYSVPSDGIVKVVIFNAVGEEVRELVNGFRNAGIYKIDFSADGLISGVYFYRMQTKDFVETKKLILLK